ncbi:50S ribosomal protein L22 [archaeon]|jgi:large subunit ribosomal protein L22|nr:50S ribosomal protein L22 [archaeon]MBT6761729.1 50S ribosomal protein L22 [archaeon]
MAIAKKQGTGSAHVATAKMRSMPISTKDSVEISNFLRYLSCDKAKQILSRVITKDQAVPYKRAVKDLGHKKGMRSGRYPVKAATIFLQLVNSVMKNAEDVGLDSSSLKITHILANKASIPMTGGRLKGATKRTHIEIKVSEFTQKTKTKVSKKSAPKKAKVEVKAEVKETAKPVTKEEVKPVVKEAEEAEKKDEKQVGESQ